MRIQVLVATMNQKDYSLLDKMNILSDVIVGNQCDYNSVETFEYKGYCAIYLNFAEKGVGLNRNNALIRATGDLCLFADDDIIYMNDYMNTVEKAFEEHKDADVIVFNVKGDIENRCTVKKDKRVKFYNFMRYGAVRFAVKLDSIRENGIFFNLNYGGGAKYRHGEDTLFLAECLKKGLKIYAVSDYIATLTNERHSTWNVGYDDKYFADQGRLFHCISKTWWKLLCFRDAVKQHRKYGISVLEAYNKMVNYENLRYYSCI